MNLNASQMDFFYDWNLATILSPIMFVTTFNWSELHNGFKSHAMQSIRSLHENYAYHYRPLHITTTEQEY